MGFTKLLKKITGSSEQSSFASERPINITPKLSSITVMHSGKEDMATMYKQVAGLKY